MDDGNGCIATDDVKVTIHPIPVLNEMDGDKFNEILEANLMKIDREVKYLVNVFLPESADVK
mgnify:CR=1 FL=1